MNTTISIIVNPKSANIQKGLNNIIECLEKYSVNLLYDQYAGEFLNRPFSSKEEISLFSDVIIVLGGDGSFLLAADLAYKKNIPILGIHMGRLGFITPFDQSEVEEAISLLFAKKLIVTEYMRLLFNVYRSDNLIYTSTVLNEVTLYKREDSKIASFDLYSNNCFVRKYRSDGFIVSTPTGSTGYSLSVGGPIASPDNSFFIMNPISPHSINNRAIIAGDKQKITIKLSEEQQEVILLKDGNPCSFYFSDSDVLEIVKAPYGTKLFTNPSRTFYDHLRLKFS